MLKKTAETAMKKLLQQQHPRDLIKKAQFTSFLGMERYAIVNNGQEESKQAMKRTAKIQHAAEVQKQLQKEEIYEAEAFNEDDGIELNRRIDKFRRKKERQKQLKRREQDKQLHDAKKLAAKLARTV